MGVFHDSLTFYQQRAPAALDAMLREQAGLESALAAVLLETGGVYAAALQQIAAAAQVQVQDLAGRERPRTVEAPPRPGTRAMPAPLLVREPGPPLFDRVRDSGLFDAVEAEKAAALAAHRAVLEQRLGAAAVARLTALVDTTVRPTIDRRALRVLPPPGPDAPSPDARPAPAGEAAHLD